jgi:hypothetical protein
MPMLEKGLPTWARAKASMRCSAAREQPMDKYVYCKNNRHRAWENECNTKEKQS